MKSKKPIALLISPGPIDGYPPVQHQARIFVEAGFAVHVISVPRLGSREGIRFSQPGVRVTALPLRTGSGLNTMLRAADFVAAIAAVRGRYATRQLVEVAFDPLGMLYSDLAPLRPALRIAHFHEVLDAFDSSPLQSRLKETIRGYACVVVADSARAELTRNQLRLEAPPIVVPNFPMLSDLRASLTHPERLTGFELVYAGSIGRDQQIDMIVGALRHLPAEVNATLYGDLRTEWGRNLAAGDLVRSLGDRVAFAGWVDYADLQRRLMRARLAVSFLDPDVLNWSMSVGASNKRYEYMRAGLPQIGDMNPGVAELIEGNGVGRCLQAFSPTVLADLIAEYVRDPSRCAAEGTRAYQLHRERFNYQYAFRPVLEFVLSNLLTSASKPLH